MATQVNITDAFLAEARKRRGNETIGFRSTLTKTDIDLGCIDNLATLKEEAFIKSVAASVRIEGARISEDEARRIIMADRINKIYDKLNNVDEKRMTLYAASKPGISFAEIVNLSPIPAALIKKVLASMVKRKLLVKTKVGNTLGYKID